MTVGRWQRVWGPHRSTSVKVRRPCAEAVQYARQHREPGSPPLDLAIEGRSPTDEPLLAYAEVGLTWWVEALGPWRGRMADLADVVAAGPPTG
jgi:hypothetical protein